MGPVECRAAVGGIYRALEEEFPDIEMISSVKGEVEGSYSSVIFFQKKIFLPFRELWNGSAKAGTEQDIRERTGLWM